MIRLQAAPIHQFMVENVKVHQLRGRTINKVSLCCCKTIFQTTDVIQTRATTKDLQEQEAQHCGLKITWYVLVLVTLISKFGFPVSIPTMKEGVFTCAVDNLLFPVSFFFFYGLHVMVEGVHLKIQPCFRNHAHPPYLNLSNVKLHGLSLFFSYDYESMVLYNPPSPHFQHLGYVNSHGLNLCFSKSIECFLWNYFILVLNGLVKFFLCIEKLPKELASGYQKLKGRFGCWYFSPLPFQPFHSLSKCLGLH